MSFETLSCDGKVYVTVAASVMVSVVAVCLFFIFGFLCGQNWKKKAAARSTACTSSESEMPKEQTPYYDDVVLKVYTGTQNQNMELKHNVAYGYTGNKTATE